MSVGACKESSHLFNHSLLKRSCHFSYFITCRKKKNYLFPSCKNHRQLVRQHCVKLACLHNLPRRLFLTIWMQSQSASLPTALWRSARVVLQPHHSCRRAPGFKTQQSDGLSLTPSRLSVSQSASLLVPLLLLLLLLQICSMLMHSLLLSSPLCLSSPLFPFALALLFLGSLSPLTFSPLFITTLSPRLNFIPSSSSSPSPPPDCHHPSLPLPPLPPLTQPICLFTFWQTSVSLY